MSTIRSHVALPAKLLFSQLFSSCTPKSMRRGPGRLRCPHSRCSHQPTFFTTAAMFERNFWRLNAPARTHPRQPRVDLSRILRARQDRRRGRPHDRPRERLHARPAHARDPARYPRPLLGGAGRVRRQRARAARGHPPAHQTPLSTPMIALRPQTGAWLLLLAAGVAACQSSPTRAPASLVVYGRVWTGDSARPWAGAVAAAGDSIVAVGDSAEIARLVGPDTRV